MFMKERTYNSTRMDRIMNMWLRILRIVALVLGIVGTVGCGYVIVRAWNAKAQVAGIAVDVFERVDGSLGAVQTRVERLQERVEEAKITAEDIEKRLKDWSQSEAVQRVAERLDISGKAEGIAKILDRGDHWLEVALSTADLAQQTMNVARQAGFKFEAKPLEGLVEDITGLRKQLAEATQFVAEIRDRTAEEGDEKTVGERIGRIVPTALRVVATLGSVDTRLAKLVDRLDQTHEKLEGIETLVKMRVLRASRGFTLLMLWMAAGQIALAAIGWKGACCCRAAKSEE